ncbi:MAG: hypothetical protein ABIJ53_02895, partial [Verrucomicrobiota bacterium]
MKIIIALGMLASLLNAGLLHAQEETAPADATNAMVTAEPTVVSAETDTITDTNVVAATGVPAETNILVAAEPNPPEDPIMNMIARFSFDAGIMPEPATGGFDIPVVFQRESPAFLNGQELGANMPRLVAGKFG